MARTHGRCRRDERLRMSVPHSHRTTTTFVVGLTRCGMIAPFVIGRPINRDTFETYLSGELAPERPTGDVATLDNLSSHKGSWAGTDRGCGRGAELPPPHRPDFNPTRKPSAASPAPSCPPNASTASAPAATIQAGRIPH